MNKLVNKGLQVHFMENRVQNLFKLWTGNNLGDSLTASQGENFNIGFPQSAVDQQCNEDEMQEVSLMASLISLLLLRKANEREIRILRQWEDTWKVKKY